MKNFNFYSVSVVVVLLLASCKDNKVEMISTVDNNGSCSRVLFFETDSAGLLGGLYSNNSVVRLNDEWDIQWCIKNEQNKWQPYPMSASTFETLRKEYHNVPDTVLLRAERHFDSVEEMSEAFPVQIAGELLQADGQLDKKFHWFYTDYKYTETIKGLQGKFPVPFADYIDDESAVYWFTGHPDILQGYTPSESKDKLNNIEMAVNKWLNANYFYYLYDMMAAHYDSVKNAPVDKATFLSMRDSAMQFAMNRNFNLSMAETDKIFTDFFSSDAYSFMFEQDSEYMNYLSDKVKWFAELILLKIAYYIDLPGNITDTGWGLYDGATSSVYYPISGERFIPQDYAITATSRDVNEWAYVLTALVAIAGIVVWWRAHK